MIHKIKRIKMTAQELADKFGGPIAMDKNGQVWLFNEIPQWNKLWWVGSSLCDAMRLDQVFDIDFGGRESEDSLTLPETDWSQVPRDTWVVVWDREGQYKLLRRFAWKMGEDDYPFVTFVDGYSSHSTRNTAVWRYCRLANAAEREQAERGDYGVIE